MLFLLFYSQNILAVPTNAVLILGGRLGASKSQFENELMQCKKILEHNDVFVSFYDESNTTWNAIVEDSKVAGVFIYFGHGVNISGNYGGLLLANGQVITPGQINRDLHFYDRAIVYLVHTCGSAGSSSSDISGITESQAQNRVMNYADPFVKNGANAVLSVNWNDQVLSFLNDMFTFSKTDTLFTEYDTVLQPRPSSIGESYVRICTELNQSIIINLPYPGNEEMTLYVSHNDPSIKREYMYVINEEGEKDELYVDKPTGKKGPITYELSFVGNSNFRW